MMREFMFEEEMHQSLACVPMAVRRKLDRLGVKSRKRSAAVSAWPCVISRSTTKNERETLKLFMAEAVERACGEQPKTLAESERAIAEPPHMLPAEVGAAPRAENVRLEQAACELLDAHERDALIDLGGSARHSHKLAAALAEFAER